MTLKVGQRFKWTYPTNEVIIEIIDVNFSYNEYTIKCIQKITTKMIWNIGQIEIFHKDDFYCKVYEKDIVIGEWLYLEGQDKPII